MKDEGLSPRWIFSITLVIHLLLFALLFSSPSLPKRRPPSSMRVHTLSLQGKVSPPVAVLQTTHAQPAAAAPQQKQEKAKAAPKKKASSAKKSSATPSSQTKAAPQERKENKELEALMQKTLATLAQSERLLQEPIAVSTSPHPEVEVAESPSGAVENSYPDRLAFYLQQLLSLPERGVVKLDLTLRNDGSVISVHIRSSESRANRDYIEKQLPTLTLPPFEGPYRKEAVHTFTLSLEPASALR
jgi:outer membrane biosynthesis protein TonB